MDIIIEYSPNSTCYKRKEEEVRKLFTSPDVYAKTNTWSMIQKKNLVEKWRFTCKNHRISKEANKFMVYTYTLIMNVWLINQKLKKREKNIN